MREGGEGMEGKEERGGEEGERERERERERWRERKWRRTHDEQLHVILLPR